MESEIYCEDYYLSDPGDEQLHITDWFDYTEDE